DFGSYQQVAGAWFPFAMEGGAHNGPRTMHLTIDKAEANVAADDAWFRFPTARVARAITAGAGAKGPEPTPPPAASGPVVVDSGTISGLGARNIGSAAMSGRVAAVAAVNQGGKTTIFIGA